MMAEQTDPGYILDILPTNTSIGGQVIPVKGTSLDVDPPLMTSGSAGDGIIVSNSDVNVTNTLLPGYALRKASRVLTLVNNTRLAVSNIVS